MMMHQKKTVRYLCDDKSGFRVMEKKFSGETADGKAVSLVAFLPHEADGLAGLESKLNAGLISRCRDIARPQKVEVTLPRMEISFKCDQIKKRLADMGFPMDADAGNLADDAYVSQLIHKAKFHIDEEGAEGAAATGAIMRSKCCSFSLPESFDARHPFAYYIMAGDDILFQGSVTDTSCMED